MRCCGACNAAGRTPLCMRRHCTVLPCACHCEPIQWSLLPMEVVVGGADRACSAGRDIAMALDVSNGFGVSSSVPELNDLPIFTVERVQLQFSIAADFVAAQVANNIIVLALSNGRILRIDLERPEDIDGV